MSDHSQRRMANSSHQLIEAQVSKYYGKRLQDHGATPKGVDWKDEFSQTIRFEQLAQILSGDMAASVIDWGCGYGALLTFLRERGFTGAYVGLDISAQMITAARAVATFPDRRLCMVARRHGWEVLSGGHNQQALEPDSAEWSMQLGHLYRLGVHKCRAIR